MTLRRLTLFVLVFLTPVLVSAAPGRIERDFSRLDAAVRELPPARSIAGTIELLDGVSSDDWDRVRTVYVWLTENIAYDADAYFSGHSAVTDADGVFRSGKSVCQGYSELFEVLAEGLGLECVLISGYAKGYGYSPESVFYRTNHAWNAVRIDGEWHHFDSTWGAGHVDGRRFVRDYSGFWFDPHPELYLWTHLPEEDQWQLVPHSLSMEDYTRRDYHPSFTFENLHALGFKDDAVIESLRTGAGLPSAYRYTDYRIEIIEAPVSDVISSGATVTVALSVPGVEKAAFINNGEFTFFDYSDGILKGTFRPKSGKLTVAALMDYRDQESYWSILEYRVR